MPTGKKAQSKPTAKAKKKAVTLADLQAQLNAIRQQVAYCVVRLGSSNEEEPHPIVVEAEEAVLKAEEEFKFKEAEKAFEAERALENE